MIIYCESDRYLIAWTLSWHVDAGLMFLHLIDDIAKRCEWVDGTKKLKKSRWNSKAKEGMKKGWCERKKKEVEKEVRRWNICRSSNLWKIVANRWPTNQSNEWSGHEYRGEKDWISISPLTDITDLPDEISSISDCCISTFDLLDEPFSSSKSQNRKLLKDFNDQVSSSRRN